MLKRSTASSRLNPADIWYGRGPAARAISTVLAPLGWLYCGIAALRASGYRRGWLASTDVGVPVIVVGNLTVGGTGKTPLVRWLVAHLRNKGFRPGIAARGYGGGAGRLPSPQRVTEDGDPSRCGDEPVLLAADGLAPVMVGADRVAVAQALARHAGCDLVVTDDGLQHYRLRRCLEILVQDGARGLGNGRCLPAGPLREPARRGARADLAIATGGRPGMFALQLTPREVVQLAAPGTVMPLAAFAGVRVKAVAGIGHPARFFRMLTQHGIDVEPRPYPDHHRYSAADLAAWGSAPVLMTEKDAVKCRRLDPAPNLWMVPVRAVPDAAFVDALDRLLETRGLCHAGAGSAG
jgi:tetraacyldisaccharide 4'-kinase